MQHTCTIDLDVMGRVEKGGYSPPGAKDSSNRVMILDLANSLINRFDDEVMRSREKSNCQSHCD